MKKIILFLCIWGLCFAEGLERAEKLYKSGLFQSALDLLKDTEGAYPTYLRAECLFQLKEYEKAHKEFLKASKMRQENERLVLISFRIPECLWLSGRKKEAIAEYENAVKAYPEDSQAADVLYRIGLYYSRVAPLKAIDAFTQLLRDHPDIENIDNIYYLLGLAFDTVGDTEQGAKYFKKVLDSSKRADLCKPAYLWTIDWLYKKGDFPETIILAEYFTKEYPVDARKIQETIFSCLYNLKRYHSAVVIFPCIEKPSQEQFFAYAEALYETANYHQAAEAYKNAGTSSSIYYGLGFSYLMLGSLTEAFNSFSCGVAFKMITRRQGENDEGILNSMLKEPTTKLTLVMFEGDFVSQSDVTEDTLYLMADIAQRMKEKNAEIECYKALLKLYPESKIREEILGRLGLSLIDGGRIQEAEDLCQEMEKDHPTSSYRLQLLYNIVNIKEGKEALPYLSKILTDFADFAENHKLLYRLSEINYGLERYDEAERCFCQLFERFPGSELLPPALFHLASIYEKKGDLKKAKRTYELIPSFSQESAPKALFYSANLSFSEKDYRSALDNYNKIIKDYPKNEVRPQATYQIGWCYYKMDDFEKAKKYFKAVLEEQDESLKARALYWAGWASFMEEDFKEAENLYSKVLERYPGDPISSEVRLRLAIVLYNQGRYKEAQATYQKVLEEATSTELKIEAIHQVADCLLKQKKAGGAISYYKLWLEKLENDEKRWEIQLKIAEIYYQTGQKELAREEYERFLEFGPTEKRDEAYYWIAKSYLPDQPKEAFKYFKKVVDFYPQSDWAADSLFKMAIILDDDGDNKEAKIIFERFIKEYKDRQDLVLQAKRYLKD